MDTLDQSIGGHHFERASVWFNYGRIVTNTDSHPGRRFGYALTNTVNQSRFAEVADRDLGIDGIVSGRSPPPVSRV